MTYDRRSEIQAEIRNEKAANTAGLFILAFGGLLAFGAGVFAMAYGPVDLADMIFGVIFSGGGIYTLVYVLKSVMTITLAKKLLGVAFWGGLGLFLLYSGALSIGHAATDSALSLSGIVSMLVGGLGVIRALMVATRS